MLIVGVVYVIKKGVSCWWVWRKLLIKLLSVVIRRVSGKYTEVYWFEWYDSRPILSS